MATPCGSGRRWTRAVKITLCLFFLIPMSSVGIRNTTTIFGEKQKLEVQQQLKFLNKPALKTIESPDGDIIDCVDIKKQPAFDHPLLKNHTIQMRPSSYPKGLLFNESDNVSSNSKPEIFQRWHLNGRCPKGTIPIRRIKEEELLRASSIANYGRKKYNIIPDNDVLEKHEYAVLEEEGGRYFGTNAEMNVWNPQIQEPNEFSLAQLWMIAVNNDGAVLDTIEAGMMVNYEIFDDLETRLFTYWTNNGYQTGCYNLECTSGGGGFVQVDTDIALGASLVPYSEYDGAQYSVNFFVYQDNEEGHWWLRVRGHHLGYWPANLFSVLNNGATKVNWGGEVINRNVDGQHTTTQMGSGHFAEEGPKRASFFKYLRVIDAQQFLGNPSSNGNGVSTHPNCYNILRLGDDSFYYGGPGRNPDCP